MKFELFAQKKLENCDEALFNFYYYSAQLARSAGEIDKKKFDDFKEALLSYNNFASFINWAKPLKERQKAIKNSQLKVEALISIVLTD